MSTVLDTIEVEIEVETPDGIDVLTLDVEITQWPTRATLEHPGDPAEWCEVYEGLTGEQRLKLAQVAERYDDTIDAQVQAYCAERERPRGEE